MKNPVWVNYDEPCFSLLSDLLETDYFSVLKYSLCEKKIKPFLRIYEEMD